MKELKVSKPIWLIHVLGVLYPGPEFVELAKIIILEVYTWVYRYTNTHKPAHLHSWIIFCTSSAFQGSCV